MAWRWSPRRLEAGIGPPHRVLTSYLLLHREQANTGGLLTQVVSAPGVPPTFGVSLGDGSQTARLAGAQRWMFPAPWVGVWLLFPSVCSGAGFTTDGGSGRWGVLGVGISLLEGPSLKPWCRGEPAALTPMS